MSASQADEQSICLKAQQKASISLQLGRAAPAVLFLQDSRGDSCYHEKEQGTERQTVTFPRHTCCRHNTNERPH